MSEVNSWSTTAASNNSAAPDGWPEGMAPSAVNDCARELMAAIAKYRSDTDGVNTTGGSSNAYTLAASRVMAAYTAGDLYTVKTNFANTSTTPTFNVDSLGAKTIKRVDGSALVVGDIPSGAIITLVYDGTDFLLLNPYKVKNTQVSSGGVVQAVEGTPYTTYATIATDMPVDNTIPQNTEGDEVVTVSITPTSATNRLVIEAECFGMIDNAGTIAMAVFQDTTANALAATAEGGAASSVVGLRIRHEMAAGTTSATTFKIRVGPSAAAANFYINGDSSARLFGGVGAARVRVTEYL